MNRWKAILRYGLVFVLGLALGVFGSNLALKYRFARGMHNRPAAMRQMVMRHLTSQLKLNNQQQIEIERIVDVKLKALSDLRAKHQPEIQAIFQEARDEMKAQLLSDQQQKLDRIMDRMQNRWRTHAGRPHRPGKRNKLEDRQGPGDDFDDPQGQ